MGNPTESPAAAAPASDTTPRADWADHEMQRRRLAEGFRSGFCEGATVVLQGLKSTPELNGKLGKLKTWNSQSLRWQVEIEGEAAEKALRPDNLVPQDSSDSGCAAKKPRLD